MIERIRKIIDKIDLRIIVLLKRRKALVLKLQAYKELNNIPLRDPEREAQILERAGEFKNVFKEVLK